MPEKEGPKIFFSDKDLAQLDGDMSYLTTRAEREALFKKYAGIQLNNDQAVALKMQEALKAEPTELCKHQYN